MYSKFTMQSILLHVREESSPDCMTISGSAITNADPVEISDPVVFRIHELSRTPVLMRTHELFKVPVLARIHELSKIPVLARTPELFKTLEELCDSVYPEWITRTLSENISGFVFFAIRKRTM